MGFSLAKLWVEIGARTSPMDQALSETKGKLTGFAGQLGAMAGGLATKAGAIGAAFAALGAAKDSLFVASDLNETVSKTGVVFGEAAGSVNVFADAMQLDFGSSKREILDAASNFGLIAQAAGQSKQEAAGMAVTLARLADDASSFHNVGLDEALNVIRSSLVGEGEPIKRFGVLLNEAAVQNEALRLGLVRSSKELTEKTKVMARYSLIQKGMAVVEGDHARTQSGFSNQFKEAGGRIEGLKASFGSALGTIFTPAITLGNQFLKILKFIPDAFNEIVAAVGRYTDKIVQSIPFLKAFKDAAGPPEIPATKAPDKTAPAPALALTPEQKAHQDALTEADKKAEHDKQADILKGILDRRRNPAEEARKQAEEGKHSDLVNGVVEAMKKAKEEAASAFGVEGKQVRDGLYRDALKRREEGKATDFDKDLIDKRNRDGRVMGDLKTGAEKVMTVFERFKAGAQGLAAKGINAFVGPDKKPFQAEFSSLSGARDRLILDNLSKKDPQLDEQKKTNSLIGRFMENVDYLFGQARTAVLS